MRKTLALGTTALVSILVAACGGSHTSGSGTTTPAGGGMIAAGGGACRVHSIAKPLGQPHQGSSVALAMFGDRQVALVADEDAHAVSIVDLASKKEVGHLDLDGAPSQLLVTADGRVLVTLRDRGRLEVLEAESATSLVPRCAAETPDEPIAIATTADDAMVLVTSGFGRALTAFETTHLKPAFVVSLPREPRAVVISDDGTSAFVSHAVGSVISKIDLKAAAHPSREVSIKGSDASFLRGLATQRAMFARMKASIGAADVAEMEKQFEAQRRPSCQGFALAKAVAPGGRILAPQVFVDPGQPEQRPEGYGSSHQATESASIAVLDDATGEPFEPSVTLQRGLDWRGEKTPRDHRDECLLPRAAAVDSKTRMLLVSCFGIDTVVGYDAGSADPQTAERRRWTVGAGSTGIAVDPTSPRAYVWSQFDRTLQVLSLAGADVTDDKANPPPPVEKIGLGAASTKLPAELALGRLLFHAAGDSRISKDGRACASCHPDGRDDAITWATPEGPRRSISLSGRVATETRFAWTGGTKNLTDHVHTTFDRLNGTGLHSTELSALTAYVNSLGSPVSAPIAADPKAKRGAQIFASKEAGCASCHSGSSFSDGTLHDVHSATESDRGPTFRTPSLHLVGGAGPYFHDGRYKNLHDLLKDSDGKMGHTKQLSEADFGALESYLRTL